MFPLKGWMTCQQIGFESGFESTYPRMPAAPGTPLCSHGLHGQKLPCRNLCIHFLETHSASLDVDSVLESYPAAALSSYALPPSAAPGNSGGTHCMMHTVSYGGNSPTWGPLTSSNVQNGRGAVRIHCSKEW